MLRPLATIVVATVAVMASAASAQVTARPTAQSLYQDALTRERALRADLADPGADVNLASVRSLIASYEAIVRRFPISGYSDNALWQAAGLAREAAQRWNQDRDRRAAERFLTWLVNEYPASPFVARARSELANAKSAAAAPAPRVQSPPSRPGVQTAPPAPPAAAATGEGVAELRAVRRTSLPGFVRVTIELSQETEHTSGRVQKPAQLLLDFPATRVSPALAGETLAYSGDVVRLIRIEARPGQASRVAIDLEGVKAFSTYEMYEPYRLVVDLERAQRANSPPAAPPPSPQAPAPRPLAAAAWGPMLQPLRSAAVGTPPPRDSGSARAAAAARPAAVPAREKPPEPPVPATRPAERPATPESNAGGGFSLARQLGLGVSRIVIDPGHGGYDPGAQGGGANEADVVLDVALRLEKLLLAEPETDVVLTRRTDSYVGLEDRTAIANRAQADLFLSIHVNANRSRSVSGVETYFLNFANTPDAAAVAARENAAAGMNMGSLPDIVKTIALTSKANESREFATLVQQAMVRRLGSLDQALKNLGVKQAPFVVLIGAAMPSILVEVAFITNGQESRLLRNAAFRQGVAESLADGIRRYQKTLKVARPIQPQ